MTKEKKTKNIFKFMKNIRKNSLQSKEEVENARKEISKILLISVVVIIVCIVFSRLIGALIPSIRGLIGIVFTVLGVVALFTAIRGLQCRSILKKTEKRMAKLNCTECNERLTYSNDISYNVEKAYSTSNDNVGVVREYSAIIIECTCSNCQRKNYIGETFLTRRTVKGKEDFSRELDELIKDHFNYKFQTNIY